MLVYNTSMDAFVRRDEAMEEQNGEFKCKRCNYAAKHSSVLIRHLLKKTICTPIDPSCDIPPDVLICELKTQKAATQSHKCRVCGKGFATYQSRFVHERTHLQKTFTTEVTGTDYIIEKVAEAVARRLQHNNAPTTNIINGNVTVTNNIQINAFNKEDLSYIINDASFLNQCIARTNKGLIELVGKIHFNSDKPENMNIRLTNCKGEYMKFYDGNSWQVEQKKKLAGELIDKSFEIMEDHYESHKQEILRNRLFEWSKHIRQWMADMSDKQKMVLKPLFKELYTMAYNESKKSPLYS